MCLSWTRYGRFRMSELIQRTLYVQNNDYLHRRFFFILFLDFRGMQVTSNKIQKVTNRIFAHTRFESRWRCDSQKMNINSLYLCLVLRKAVKNCFMFPPVIIILPVTNNLPQIFCWKSIIEGCVLKVVCVAGIFQFMLNKKKANQVQNNSLSFKS